jgi:hypothetical protein
MLLSLPPQTVRHPPSHRTWKSNKPITVEIKTLKCAKQEFKLVISSYLCTGRRNTRIGSYLSYQKQETQYLCYRTYTTNLELFNVWNPKANYTIDTHCKTKPRLKLSSHYFSNNTIEPNNDNRSEFPAVRLCTAKRWAILNIRKLHCSKEFKTIQRYSNILIGFIFVLTITAKVWMQWDCRLYTIHFIIDVCC